MCCRSSCEKLSTMLSTMLSTSRTVSILPVVWTVVTRAAYSFPPPQHFSARSLKETLRHTCTFSYTYICGRCLGLHSVYRLCRLRCHCRRICTGHRLLPFVKKEYGQKSGYELYIYRCFTVHQRQRLHSSRTHALRRHLRFLPWPLQAYNTVGRLKRECDT